MLDFNVYRQLTEKAKDDEAKGLKFNIDHFIEREVNWDATEVEPLDASSTKNFNMKKLSTPKEAGQDVDAADRRQDFLIDKEVLLKLCLKKMT